MTHVTSPRAGARSLPKVDPYWPENNLHEWSRKLAEVVNGALDGKISATGTLTLTASATSTTLSDKRIGIDTRVVLVPTTANAAAAMATTYQTIPNATKQQAVINHASNSQTDKTYSYALFG